MRIFLLEVRMRFYYFWTKFWRSFLCGLGIGGAAAVVLFSLVFAVPRVRLGL